MRWLLLLAAAPSIYNLWINRSIDWKRLRVSLILNPRACAWLSGFRPLCICTMGTLKVATMLSLIGFLLIKPRKTHQPFTIPKRSKALVLKCSKGKDLPNATTVGKWKTLVNTVTVFIKVRISFLWGDLIR